MGEVSGPLVGEEGAVVVAGGRLRGGCFFVFGGVDVLGLVRLFDYNPYFRVAFQT